MPANNLTYRNVLTCKTWLGDIARMYKHARELGYEYFLWNDRVYRIPQQLGGQAEVIDTGMTVNDIS